MSERNDGFTELTGSAATDALSKEFTRVLASRAPAPTKGWITTATGRQFFPLEPRIDDICIEDIAHALGAVNRFNGHTGVPYSVAQHSVLLSRHLAPDGPLIALVALLHDASEAYLGDVPRPLKVSDAFAGYRAVEARLQELIYAKYDISEVANDPHVVKLLKIADRRMLRTEQAQLMPPDTHGEDRNDVAVINIIISPWEASNASARFLGDFYTLRAQIAQLQGRH
jgi:uncharacterized protein